MIRTLALYSNGQSKSNLLLMASNFSSREKAGDSTRGSSHSRGSSESCLCRGKYFDSQRSVSISRARLNTNLFTLLPQWTSGASLRITHFAEPSVTSLPSCISLTGTIYGGGFKIGVLLFYRATPLAYGLLLLMLALHKARKHWKLSGLSGSRLVFVLIRDQAIYYALYVWSH